MKHWDENDRWDYNIKKLKEATETFLERLLNCLEQLREQESDNKTLET